MMQGVVTNSGMELWNSALMPAWMCVTCIGSGVSQLSTSGVWLWLYKATSWHLFLCSAVLLCHVHVVRSWQLRWKREIQEPCKDQGLRNIYFLHHQHMIPGHLLHHKNIKPGCCVYILSLFFAHRAGTVLG